MKFKYKQRKPKSLEEYLRGRGEDSTFAKCPKCGYIYNKDNNKKICSNCADLIEGKHEERINNNFPF